MPEVLLVRHGQSTWNAEGRWQGRADPPLTSKGIEQAKAASLALGVVDAVFCSPLQRARATAQAFANHLGLTEAIEVDGFAERDAGEWEGLTRVEIEQRYPGYLDKGRRPPRWEGDDEVVERARSALDAILITVARAGRPVGAVSGGGSAAVHVLREEGARIDAHLVVVTHSGLIMQFERSLGAPFEKPANLGGRWIRSLGLDGDTVRWELGPRVDLLEGDLRTVPGQI
ncbi:MAG: histidine phosphatase family protein [Microthrixaceae bacterium]